MRTSASPNPTPAPRATNCTTKSKAQESKHQWCAHPPPALDRDAPSQFGQRCFATLDLATRKASVAACDCSLHRCAEPGYSLLPLLAAAALAPISASFDVMTTLVHPPPRRQQAPWWLYRAPNRGCYPHVRPCWTCNAHWSPSRCVGATIGAERTSA